jgi:hypothetical protein
MTFAKHPKTPPLVAYEDDAYGWATEQAALLRTRRFDLVDVENMAEEIESVGRSEYAKLESALRVILLHLLKWDYQPERRSTGWALSAKVHRVHARRTLQRSPGLKSHVAEAFTEGYELARIEAAGETGLPESTFPQACPYDLDAVMNRELGETGPAGTGA